MQNLGPKLDFRANEAKASGQISSRDNGLISQGQRQHLDLGPLPGKQAANIIKEGPDGREGLALKLSPAVGITPSPHLSVGGCVGPSTWTRLSLEGA